MERSSDVEPTASKTLVVDGNNVVGTAVAGWWRDPPSAVRRLLDRLRYAAETGDSVELVLDIPQPDLPEGKHDPVIVRYAARRGRDAADDRIIELLDAGELANVEIVTSDRTLAESARVAAGHSSSEQAGSSFDWTP